MNKVISSVLMVGSLALLGGACYKVADTNVSGNTNVSTNVNVNTNGLNVNSSVNTNSSTIDISDWLTHTDERFAFSFKYPANWVYSSPISGDQQGLGYLDPVGFGEDYHLVSLKMDLVPYQQVLDREITEWEVTKRETQVVNGVEITHEVGVTPRNMGTVDYTYNSYIIPFEDSKTLTLFLADNNEEYIQIVNAILDSLTF